MGALDTDVSPEDAQVYVDGQMVGTADDFDGYPDLLWLEPGTYDVVFYRPGFRTIARQYSIYSGQVIDVEDRMETGESIAPEDLQSKSTVRAEERLRRDAERRAALVQPAWEGPWDAGRLTFLVTPEDASVYLDGRFVGTGKELMALRAGLVVEPGQHRLDVVRPGFEEASSQVELAEGDDLEVTITLVPSDSSESAQ
jgi:hypothetical protein